MENLSEDKNIKRAINIMAMAFTGMFFILAINTAISLYKILGENSLQQLYIIFFVAFAVATGLYVGVSIIYYLFKGLKFLFNYLKGEN